MSLYLPTRPDPVMDAESGSESSSDDDDQEFGDWVSDSGENQPCKSLFGDELLKSSKEAVEHDKKKHNFDLDAVFTKLGSLTSDLSLLSG